MESLAEQGSALAPKILAGLKITENLPTVLLCAKLLVFKKSSARICTG